MNNLKAKHILVWMLFSMLMPIIPIASTLGFAELSHKSEDYLALMLFFISYAGLITIPLSLLNLFLFKRSQSTDAAKRIATIPLGFSVVCSGILFLLGCLTFFCGRFEAMIILVATALHFFTSIKAIYWFRDKIEKLTSGDNP